MLVVTPATEGGLIGRELLLVAARLDVVDQRDRVRAELF